MRERLLGLPGHEGRVGGDAADEAELGRRRGVVQRCGIEQDRHGVPSSLAVRRVAGGTPQRPGRTAQDSHPGAAASSRRPGRRTSAIGEGGPQRVVTGVVDVEGLIQPGNLPGRDGPRAWSRVDRRATRSWADIASPLSSERLRRSRGDAHVWCRSTRCACAPLDGVKQLLLELRGAEDVDLTLEVEDRHVVRGEYVDTVPPRAGSLTFVLPARIALSGRLKAGFPSAPRP